MRILILGDDYCPGMTHLDYPVEVEAIKIGKLFYVLPCELARIGARMVLLKELPYLIYTEDEVEVLEIRGGN